MADYLWVWMSAEILRKVLEFVGEDAWVAKTVCSALRHCGPIEPACRCSKCGTPRKEYIVTERCGKHRRAYGGAQCLDCGSLSEFGDCRHRFAVQPQSAVSSIERYQWTTEWLRWPKKITLPAAVASGRRDVFKLAFDPLPDGKVCDSVFLLAAMCGHIDIIKTALAGGCEWDFDSVFMVCGAAAQSGHVDIIKLALKSQEWSPYFTRQLAASISDGAGSGGQISVIQWAADCGLLVAAAAAVAAARANQGHAILEMMMMSVQPEDMDAMLSDPGVCAAAAGGGHLELLRELRAGEFPWDSDTCKEAAEGGHLAVLEYARAKHCPWSSVVLNQAAARPGNIDMLRWMCKNGCMLNPEACASAAYNGLLDNLEFLRSVPVDWDAGVCDAAAMQNHLPVLQWAHENGCPWTNLDRARLVCNSAVNAETREWIRSLLKGRYNLRS